MISTFVNRDRMRDPITDRFWGTLEGSILNLILVKTYNNMVLKVRSNIRQQIKVLIWERIEGAKQ